MASDELYDELYADIWNRMWRELNLNGNVFVPDLFERIAESVAEEAGVYDVPAFVEEMVLRDDVEAYSEAYKNAHNVRPRDISLFRQLAPDVRRAEIQSLWEYGNA